MDSNPSRKTNLSIQLKSIILLTSTFILTTIVSAQEGGGIFSNGIMNSGGGILDGLANFADQIVLFRINSPRDLMIFGGLFAVSYGMTKLLVDRAIGEIMSSSSSSSSSTTTATGDDGVWAVRLISLGAAYVTMTLVGFWFAGLAALILGVGGFAMIITSDPVKDAFKDLYSGAKSIKPDGGAITSETEDLFERVKETERHLQDEDESDQETLEEVEIELREGEDIVEKIETMLTESDTYITNLKEEVDEILEYEKSDTEKVENWLRKEHKILADIKEKLNSGNLTDEFSKELEEEIKGIENLKSLLQDFIKFLNKYEEEYNEIKELERQFSELENDVSKLEGIEEELESIENFEEHKISSKKLSEEENATNELESKTKSLEKRLGQEKKKVTDLRNEITSIASTINNTSQETEDLIEDLLSEENMLKNIKESENHQERNISKSLIGEIEQLKQVSDMLQAKLEETHNLRRGAEKEVIS